MNERDTSGNAAENRMATLLLLAKGRAPSWSRLRQERQEQQQQRHQMQLQNQREQHQQRRSMEQHSRNNSTPKQKTVRWWRILSCLWIISVSVKVLLFPSYRSTDFDVHRHWKALTLHLPHMTEWHYDDQYVNTRHTLDYPPAFALVEYAMATAAMSSSSKLLLRLVTQRFFGSQNDDGNDDVVDACLALRDDASVAMVPPSPVCVALMRSTVILVSDSVYWMGSLAIAMAAMAPGIGAPNETQGNVWQRCPTAMWMLFVFLIFHPGMIWLDHVHFQYNGLFLGIFLLSIACLLQANHHCNLDFDTRGKTGSSSTALKSSSSSQNWLHLVAAGTFSLLVSLKHLYLTMSFWYGVYLLRRYCFVTSVVSSDRRRPFSKYCWLAMMGRLLSLMAVAATVALAPLSLFVRAIQNKVAVEAPDSSVEFYSSLYAWIEQVLSRLFPFGRGLVHSYWAGNVWAIGVASHKAVTWIVTRAPRLYVDDDTRLLASLVLESVNVTPLISAVCMILAQTPGLVLAWQAAAERCNSKLLQSLTLTALATFLFQYHAHEKAIMTALLPATVWAFYAMHSTTKPNATSRLTSASTTITSVTWQFTVWSLLGLFPLLFQPQESLLKFTSFVAYLSFWLCIFPFPSLEKPWTSRWLLLTASIATLTVIQLEALAPLGAFGRYEFLPLAVTSLVCAFGFLHVFAQLYNVQSH